MAAPPDACPACGADLWDETLEEHRRRDPCRNSPRRRREISVVDPDRDCVVAYRCPDCGAERPRALGAIIAAQEIA